MDNFRQQEMVKEFFILTSIRIPYVSSNKALYFDGPRNCFLRMYIVQFHNCKSLIIDIGA